MRITRALLASLAAGATIAALAACGASDDGGATAPETTSDPALEELIEAAQAEGSLTWYSGATPAAGEATAAAFQEKYGIQTTFVRLNSADVAQRFQAEVSAENVQVDVMSTVNLAFFQDMAAKGSTRELTDDDFNELPEEHRGEGYGVNLISPIAFHYNTDVLGDFVPETWDDLLDPALKGQIVLSDPRASNAWAQMWSVVLRDPDLGEQFLEDVAAQDFQLVDGGVTALQLVQAGEGGLAIGGIPSSIVTAVEQGAPIENWIPSDPAYGTYNYLAIATDAPHPNAATLFAHWMWSEEGSAFYAGKEGSSSPLGDLEGTLPLPEGMVTPSVEQTKEDLPKVLAALGIS